MGQVGFMQQYFPLFFVRGQDMLLGAGIAAGLGLLAGIIPALQAMNLRLADALRREG